MNQFQSNQNMNGSIYPKSQESSSQTKSSLTDQNQKNAANGWTKNFRRNAIICIIIAIVSFFIIPGMATVAIVLSILSLIFAKGKTTSGILLHILAIVLALASIALLALVRR